VGLEFPVNSELTSEFCALSKKGAKHNSENFFNLFIYSKL
jgi:hypothetical protein